MPCIKPVSDLRNYNEILQNVSENSPVFLTKNGRGCYAVLTMRDYEKMSSELKLLSVLRAGEESAKKQGWIPAENVRGMLGL